MPKPGYGLKADELIMNSEHILIAELQFSEVNDRITTHHFKVLENLKGEWSGTLTFVSYSKIHSTETFENHSSEEFWKDDVDRSEWPCCICGPDHTFQKGYKYILFPDSFGARKSAEIIADMETDMWYQYIMGKLK